MWNRKFAGQIAIAVHQFRYTPGRGEAGKLREAGPNGESGERQPLAVLRPSGKSAHERPCSSVVVAQGIVETMLVGQPTHAPISGEVGLGKDSRRCSSLLRLDLIRDSQQYTWPNTDEIGAMAIGAQTENESVLFRTPPIFL